MLRRSKIILGTPDFTALYDKGYHTGCEIKAAITAGIDLMVAVPGVVHLPEKQEPELLRD